MGRLLLLSFFLCSVYSAIAQQYEISGTIKSKPDNIGLPGAAVILQKDPESSSRTSQGMTTDVEGNFRFESVPGGSYTLQVQFVGYSQKEIIVNVSDESVNLGVIFLEEESTTLQELVVVGQMPVGEQRADTTEFLAGAFKTARDATSQDLLEKLPGVEMVDGRLQAQGENVQQILIDGKPFFGTDVNAALQSLPADAVASIQVFDQKSDKALVSGFDDGERIRTVNIITKPNRKRGTFGKILGGYGTDDRYMAAASINFFNEKRRITTTGLSNNINTLNFSADPNDNSQSRPENGIIRTHSGGINFIDTWNGNIDFSGSYSYTNRENQRAQYVVRDYVSSDSGQVYYETSTNTAINTEHRADMRIDYKINSRNRLIITPSVSLKGNQVSSFFFGNTETNNGPLNQTENNSRSDNTDNDYHSRINYGHQFLKKGRSVSVRLNTSYHTNTDNAFRTATNVFFNGDQTTEILNQYTDLGRTGFSWETGLSFTEPISQHSQVEIEYEIGNRLNDSDKRTFNYNDETGMYSRLDSAISNTFKSEYTTQETEIGYQYRKGKLTAQVELEYQRARLTNDQVFPGAFNLRRTFDAYLPSARLEYKFNRNSNLQVNYRTWTNEPSVGQLQNVIDNSNPLQLRTGNPTLDQSYNSWVRAQFRSNNPDTRKSIFASIQGNFTSDYIANNTFIAEEATPLSEDITLEKGSQLIRPVNVDGFADVRSYVNFTRPWDLIKSNISLSGSGAYSRRPGLLNDQLNIAATSSFGGRVGISSNISPNLDFNISARGRYNIVTNSLRPTLNNNFYNQRTQVRLSWIIWEGLVVRTDINHQVNNGLAAGVNQNFALWNASIGKKLFRNQLGEISLLVFDILKQNNSVRRNISEVFIEDTQSNVLQRYFMITFTYNLRHFRGGATMEDYEKSGRD